MIVEVLTPLVESAHSVLFTAVLRDLDSIQTCEQLDFTLQLRSPHKKIARLLSAEGSRVLREEQGSGYKRDEHSTWISNNIVHVMTLYSTLSLKQICVHT